MVTILISSSNNNVLTVFDKFIDASSEYGLPSRIRCDHGVENGEGKLQSYRLGEVTEKCQIFCQNCDENEVQTFCEDCDLNYCLTCPINFTKRDSWYDTHNNRLILKKCSQLKGKKNERIQHMVGIQFQRVKNVIFSTDFYQNAWKYMGDPYIFKKYFVTEATTQLDIQSRMRKT
ncbi:unnamed protein product [Mytilus coruscus]|uniref:B box-type domain-containing protein n=1 Tax=Mytilus coruscus TaxID=42192 RepID=A0A6J8BPP2_MYTCO|nr:unnamed protein product [Mytilus coruscus]